MTTNGKVLMKIKTAIAAAGLICATAGHSYTGNNLLEACTLDDQPGVGHAICSSYVRGVVEALQLGPVMLADDFDMSKDSAAQLHMVCFPEGTTHKQIVKVIVKQMQLNPEQQHWNAIEIVSYTLRAAFPCELPAKQGDIEL